MMALVMLCLITGNACENKGSSPLVFFLKTNNPMSTQEKHQTNPYWGTFYKILDQYSSNIMVAVNKDQEIIVDQRR